MKTKILSILILGLAMFQATYAQDSESLNIASDQSASMDKLDILLGRAQKRLARIDLNLRALTDGDEKNNSFENFKENLEDLRSIRDDIKDRVEKVRELQGARIAAWTKEVSGMNDKNMRKLTNDQIDKAKGDFDTLDKQMREVGGDANDLTGLLEDLKKYFESSFSADSVKAAKTQIEGAQKSANEMIASVDALRDNLEGSKKIVKGTSAQ